MIAALLLLALPQASDAAEALEAARLRGLWEKLGADEKREAVAWFSAEVDALRGFRAELRRYVLSRTPGAAAAALPAEPVPYYEPSVHAPAQPIARKRLAPDAPELKALRQRMLRKVPERGLRPAFEYDPGARRVVRVAEPDDPERVFASGLAGYGPADDLVEALVLAALDDGAEQEALAAFGHAYTDREGRVYTGLTLYDAWASGAEMEMPDVDSLGVIHDLLGDWKSFKAPVPAGRQKKLYQRIGELFTPAHRHWGLRRAFAWTYLAGSAALRDGYAFHTDLLHALWDEHASEPETLAKDLPDAKRWDVFLERQGRRVDKDPKLAERGRSRRATLDLEARATREALARVVDGLWAQREAAPALGGEGR